MGIVLCLSHWPSEEDLDRNIVDIFSDRIQTNRQFGRDNFFCLANVRARQKINETC